MHIRLVFPPEKQWVNFSKISNPEEAFKNNNNTLLPVPQTANERPSFYTHTVSLLFLNHIFTKQLMRTTTAERSDAEAENIFYFTEW